LTKAEKSKAAYVAAERHGHMRTLKETKPGTVVSVIKIGGSGPIKRRIMEMGITKGVQIAIRKVAPLGDPVEITVRGYELSLRKSDAELIEVE
jgi:ferrous iron transport protein A